MARILATCLVPSPLNCFVCCCFEFCLLEIYSSILNHYVLPTYNYYMQSFILSYFQGASFQSGSFCWEKQPDFNSLVTFDTHCTWWAFCPSQQKHMHIFNLADLILLYLVKDVIYSYYWSLIFGVIHFW